MPLLLAWAWGVFHDLASKASKWLQMLCDPAHRHNNNSPPSKHNNTLATMRDRRSNNRALSALVQVHCVTYSVSKARLRYHVEAAFLDQVGAVRVIRTSRTRLKARASVSKAKVRVNFPEEAALGEVRGVAAKAEPRTFKLVIYRISKARIVPAVAAEA